MTTVMSQPHDDIIEQGRDMLAPCAAVKEAERILLYGTEKMNNIIKDVKYGLSMQMVESYVAVLESLYSAVITKADEVLSAIQKSGHVTMTPVGLYASLIKPLSLASPAAVPIMGTAVDFNESINKGITALLEAKREDEMVRTQQATQPLCTVPYPAPASCHLLCSSSVAPPSLPLLCPQDKAGGAITCLIMSKMRSENTTKKISDTPARLYCALGEAEIKIRDIIKLLLPNPAASKAHIDALWRVLQRLHVSDPWCAD